MKKEATFTIIKENWKAIEHYEKEVQEQSGDPEAGFNPTLFFFDGVKKLVLDVKYRGKKKQKGSIVFTKKQKSTSTFARYCPFTGKPLYQESKELEPITDNR